VCVCVCVCVCSGFSLARSILPNMCMFYRYDSVMEMSRHEVCVLVCVEDVTQEARIGCSA